MSILSLMAEITMKRQPELIEFRKRLWRWNEYVNDYTSVINDEMECFTDYYDINGILTQVVEVKVDN